MTRAVLCPIVTDMRRSTLSVPRGGTPGARHATAATEALLDLVGLPRLMSLSAGKRTSTISLIDGPVAVGHPHLVRERRVQELSRAPATCLAPDSTACQHGTLVAGVLWWLGARHRRQPFVPAVDLLIRPIFLEETSSPGETPTATLGELATAVREVIEAGARIINLSAAPGPSSDREEHQGAGGTRRGRSARHARGGRSGQRRDARDLSHHQASVGDPRRGLRCQGACPELVQPGCIDRERRAPRAGTRSGQPRTGRCRRDVQWHECGGAVRDRDDRLAVVAVPCSERARFRRWSAAPAEAGAPSCRRC